MLSLSSIGQFSRSLSYSASIVRKYDYENFLCSLLLPHSHRNFIFALRAFNVELAQVRDRVRSAEQATIRFQFWKDIIENLSKPIFYGSAIERELKDSTRSLRLSKLHFLRIINARQRHFDECGFDSLETAQQYAEDTNAPIHYLICEAHDLHSIQLHHVLSHLGRAQGLMTLLRGAVFLARSRRAVLIPLDILHKHHVSQEALLRALREDFTQHPVFNTSMTDIFYDLACVAREQAMTGVRLAADLIKSDAQQQTAYHALLPRLILPAVPVFSYLQRLELEARFDPRHPMLGVADGLLPLRLVWTAWRRKMPTLNVKS